MEVIEQSSIPFMGNGEDGPKKSTVVQEILKDSVRQRLNSDSNGSYSTFLGGVSTITDSLLLTSAALINDRLLEQFNVTCLINVAAELPDSPIDRETIDYRKIAILDDACGADLAQYFDEVADLVHNVSSEGGTTLIHCVAGVSRSASLCIAYLMKHRGLTLRDAYNHVKARRPIVRPNVGFFKQLIDYEAQLHATNTIAMVYNEHLNLYIPDVYDSQYRFHGTGCRKKSADDTSRR